MTIRVARNLAWEVLAKGRRTMCALATALAIATVLATWRGAPAGEGVDGLADLFVFVMVLSMLFVFGAFNHTHLDRRSGQTGFPNRLFIYPASTRLLVGIPMLCGVATTALLYLAWLELVLRPLGRDFPGAWPALVLAAAMAWYQAALWALAAFRVARMIALCVVGTGLVTLAILPRLEAGHGGDWSTTVRANAVMGSLIVAAYVCALVAVNQQRHAGGHGAGLRVVLEWLTNGIPLRTAPFRSAFHAQFWLEAHRGAWLLPAGMLLVMLFTMVSSALAGDVDARFTRFMLSIVLCAPLALAALCGSVASLPAVTAAEGSLGSFLATRPIDCGDMVAAKLAAAAVATTLAWLVVLVLTPIWLITWCDAEPVTALWSHISSIFPVRQRWLMLILCAATVWLITWRLAVVNLYIAITGRTVLLTAYVMIGIAAAITAVTLVAGQLDTALRFGIRETIFDAPITLAWTLNVALLIKLAVAGLTTAKGFSHGWVSVRSVLTYGGLWAVAAGIVSLTLYLLTSHEPALARVPSLGMLAALLGLLVVPLARIALAPRILAEQRHG
jgi:hypothetical protein